MNLTFIGLGAMGTAMVERLLLANYEVTVFNRTMEKSSPLVALGAHAKKDLASCVADADVVISCLLDDNAVIDVTKKMLPYLKPNTIHIGLSTILPDTAEVLNTLHLQAATKYVSAVVMGIPSAVREGKSTSFCAGNRESLNVAIPLLKTFSIQIIPIGDEAEMKAPNLMKICMNYCSMTALELISEVFVFAEKSGLDAEVVKIGLKQIYTHPVFSHYINKIANRDFDNVNFNMAGGYKDATRWCNISSVI